MNIVKTEYRPRGGASTLFKVALGAMRAGGQVEILHDGSAGTGKSRAILELICYLCTEYPMVRAAICRKTRRSMSETTLATLENIVLPLGHPARRGAGRGNRSKYTFPNGSELIILGLDDPERIKSLEIDLLYVNEANEYTLNDWEMSVARLRNQALPAKLAIADCNPDVPNHWLLGRVRGGTMTRIISRHKDNPLFWDRAAQAWTSRGETYVNGTLAALTGVRRRRLLDGEWCAAEGQVYEMFDSATHIIDAKDVPGYKAHPDKAAGEKTWNFDWTFIAIDWGKRAPGVLQAWGVTDDRMYRFMEIYRVGGEFLRKNYGIEDASEEEKTDHDYPVHAWWADRASEVAKMIDPIVIVCDTDRPKAIRLLNQRLVADKGRTPAMARPVEKKVLRKKGWLLDGIDLVQERLLPDPRDGKPSIFLVRGALTAPDPELVAKELPTCTEDEIAGYCWKQSIDGRPIVEEPDPTCADHGCDAMRFAAAFVWGKDYKHVDVPDKPVSLLSTMGEIFDWDEFAVSN